MTSNNESMASGTDLPHQAGGPRGIDPLRSDSEPAPTTSTQPASSADHLLDASDVVVSYGATRALNGVSLSVTPGRVTALLGPNGAGKTTFIRACLGLVPLSQGTISVLGDAPASAVARTGTGVMPQQTGAWSGVRATELLTYLAGLYAHPLDPEALMQQLGITDFGRTPYRRLSGGQQQLVNLAGAIIGRPSLVFLDEPTAGMDPHVKHRTWNVVRQLRDSGVGIVLTTHNMSEAETLSDRAHLIDRGRIVLSGSIAELTGENTLEEVYLSAISGTGGSTTSLHETKSGPDE